MGNASDRFLARRDRRRSVARGKSTASWYHPRFEPLESRYVLSAVVGTYLFYDGSTFDGGVPGVNAGDNNAIAPDKVAYRPNGTLANFLSVSSYSAGITGIMIDLSAGGSHAAINANDFVFKVGSQSSLASWSPAPAPSALSVSIGGGAGSTDRVTITWPSGSIENKWLQVQVLDSANTGLAETDVFFWASKVGDTGNPSPTHFSTLVAGDGGEIVAHLGAGAGISNIYDIDRSNSVTVSGDRGEVIANLGALLRINYDFAPTSLVAALTNDTGPGGINNSDGITTNASISGTLLPPITISEFRAWLNSDIQTNVYSLLQPDGTFTLSQSTLSAMHGVGDLADGSYVLHLRAESGNLTTTVADVPFTLKRSIATPGTPDLQAASDSGISNTDNTTNVTTPGISVTAEAGSTVTLYVDNNPVGSLVANPTAVFTPGPLAQGTRVIKAQAVDGAGNVSSFSATLSVIIDTVAPAVTLSSLVTFGDDVTPHITVTGSDASGLANGTEIRVDVDVNNDGDFNDSNETNRTLSSLYAGSRYFQVTPALPNTDPLAGPYLIKMRARVSDLAGNEGASPLLAHKIDTLPNVNALGQNALYRYINNGDASYAVTAAATPTIAGQDLNGDMIVDYTVHVFDLKSQTWRTPAEVYNPNTLNSEWHHWLQIIVPKVVTESTALLFITGGSTGSQPTTLNADRMAFGQFSVSTGMISVILPTVPNESLHFTDEAPGFNRSEDDIIAYTFNKFVTLGAPANEGWLAQLPMMKSAVRAMDAVQAKDTTLPNGINITDFIVTGGSKRGWTTWLTGAADSRVKAVIPDVIDLLNLDESFVHHYNYYGFFADAVLDYQETGYHLIQNALMEANQEIGRIVDPYRYLFNSNLTNIPKLLINSTGDEFFVPDSGQFYFSDIPGPKYVRYIPNTGHSLKTDPAVNPNDTRAFDSTWTFANAISNNLTLPQYSWTIDPDGGIRVTTPDSPTSVRLWQSTNPDGRDFRYYEGLGYSWTSSVLAPASPGVYVANLAPPSPDPLPLGATAFMIELTFANPAIPSKPYVFTTEVRVASNLPLTPWIFYMPTNPPPPPPGGDGDGDAVTAGLGESANALAFGLGVGINDAAPETQPADSALPGSAPAVAQSHEQATQQVLEAWSWIDDDLAASDEAGDSETLDLALAGLDDDASL